MTCHLAGASGSYPPLDRVSLCNKSIGIRNRVSNSPIACRREHSRGQARDSMTESTAQSCKYGLGSAELSSVFSLSCNVFAVLDTRHVAFPIEWSDTVLIGFTSRCAEPLDKDTVCHR